MTHEDRVRAVWREYGQGLLSDEEASRRLEQLAARTPSPRRAPRPEPGENTLRRRRWVASGHLPPRLAQLFTPCELAAIAVIAAEIRARGQCEFPIDKVAALAGVSRTSVKNALRQARRCKVLRVEERRVSRRRNLPHRVSAHPELQAWLDRGQNHARHGYKSLIEGRRAKCMGQHLHASERQRQQPDHQDQPGGRHSRNGSPARPQATSASNPRASASGTPRMAARKPARNSHIGSGPGGG